jgi:hypothetical protein
MLGMENQQVSTMYIVGITDIQIRYMGPGGTEGVGR